MRSFLLRCAVALTVSAGLVLAGAAVPVTVSAAAPPIRGVTVHSLSNEQVGDMDRTLDAARELGANTLRVDVWWSALEPADDTYASWYLDRFDRFVAGAHARGMKVLPALMWTPCWASSAPSDLLASCATATLRYAPKNPAKYAQTARFIAARYGSKLAGFQVWNEPNLTGFFTGADPARDYAGIVKATYPAVKAVAPGVAVVTGGLSGANPDFLNRLYAHGMKGSYDALAIHPYNGANSPEAKLGNPSWEFLGGIRHIRAAQAAVGDAKPLWLTEFGWNTSDLRNAAPWENGVSATTQATYFARAFGLLADPAQKLGYVQGAFAYELRDLGTSRLVGNENYGLVRNDFTRKASFAAVRAAFAGESSAPTAPSAPSAPSAAPASSSPPTGRSPSSGAAVPSPEPAPPRVRLNLAFRDTRRATGRRCARSRVVARVGGADRSGVIEVLFSVRRGRTRARRALDRRAPFRRVVHRRRAGRPRLYRVRARVRMKDGRVATLARRFRSCGV